MRAALLLVPCLALAQSADSRLIDVPPGADGSAQVPLTVIKGARPGPALGLVAGNHGYEYPPILALERLRAELDPKQIRGTVYMVHIANVPAFLGRSPFVNPVDGKNLNRVYPGRKDGTLSERIAWVITNEVIEQSDALLDLHGGDANESLRPYVYQTVTGKADIDAKTAALARATLFDHIVIDRDRPSDPAKSIYCANTATTRGKPAVTVESGYLGTRDAATVDRHVRAVLNVMKYLGMLEGKAEESDHPVVLDPAEILESPATGVMFPQVERGQTVEKGALLAYITDFFGRRIADIRAPFAGEVLYIIGTPPVNKGNPAVFVGAVKH